MNISELKIPTTKCPFCNEECIDINNFIYEYFSSHFCKCGNLKIDFYNEKKYSFYLNLKEFYQIQIHTFILNKPLLFSFVKYSKTNKDFIDKFIFDLDNVPLNLNWQDPEILLSQLLTLTTFM